MPDGSTSPIPENVRCIGCGYTLFGLLTDRCPECGRAFDRSNPTTMVFKRLPTFFRQFLKPISFTTRVLPVLATMCIAYGARLPNLDGAETALGVILWAAFFLGYLPAAFIRWILAKFFSTAHACGDRRILFRSVICLGISAVLLYCPLPTYLTFWIVRSRLNALADASLAAPYPYASMMQIGDSDVWPFHCYVDRCTHGVQITFRALSWHYPPMSREASFVQKTEPGACYRHDDPDWPLDGRWSMGKRR